MSQLELLLHPVRMRVVLALLSGAQTAGAIAAHLPDVAQATLYRQINLLADGGLLVVMNERQVRGTVERLYGLADGVGRVDSSELNHLSDADQLRYFMLFLTTLYQDFSRYLAAADGRTDRMRRVTYSKVPLYVTEAERATLTVELHALLLPYMTPRADMDAHRYLLSLIGLPDEEEKTHDPSSE